MKIKLCELKTGSELDTTLNWRRAIEWNTDTLVIVTAAGADNYQVGTYQFE